jgi:acyl carrier protein
VPIEGIVAEERLDRHGFDSVMALNVVRALEQDLGRLPATLLFEHQTLSALARYLLERHSDGLARRFGTPMIQRRGERRAGAQARPEPA